MHYEKLTVERFAIRLKEGAYKGLTGSRRAIGKTEWTKREKAQAHELADRHFASGGKSSAKAATKKASAKPAKKSDAAVVAVKPPPAPKAQAATKRAPVVSERAPIVGTVVPPGPAVLEEVTRQNSASAVIAAYRNSGPLNRLEKRAYDVATAEYAENASTAARRIMATAARGIPTPRPLKKSGEGEEGSEIEQARAEEVVTAPAGAPSRISVPNGADTANLTPEEKVQYSRVQKGAAAVPAILGQGGGTAS
jgi:hypothetical protein